MSVRLSFIGDIALNNNYSSFYKNSDSPFDNLQQSFLKTDFLVGNLESFSEGTEGFNEEKKPYLFSQGETLNLLKSLPVDLVSLANNHIGDTFISGYRKTMALLDDLGIDYFGASDQPNEEFRIYRKDIKGLKFSFINACHADTHPKLPKNIDLKVSDYSFYLLKELVLSEKQKERMVVLLFHWGGTSDYGHFPDFYQIKDARKLIDAGADAIIGHHAHCIQPFEFYKGKPILYCLGNFCFDDIISHNTIYPIRETGRLGYIAHIDFGKKIELNVEMIRNESLKIIPIPETKKSKRIRALFRIYKLNRVFFYFQRLYLRYIEPKLFYLEKSDKSIIQQIRSLNWKKLLSFIKT